MSRSSRGSIYSTKSISDVEKYEEEYNDALKKLKKDKASLKDKLRRIVSQYEEVLKQHKMEIQKYDYKFDLEKDKQKNFYEQEKHDIVREYEEKINILKDTLEKKYDLRQTQLISRYEANIKSLSQRLEKETFDKEKEREKIIYHINDKETEFTAKLGNMEEQYKKILEGHVNEKNNIRKILTERTTELNELKISIDEEKKKTIAERELYQKNVQTIKDSYEQKRKTDEKKLEELRILVQAEKDINKAEYVRNIEEIVNTSNKKIVEIKQHYENKISDSERLFEIKIKNIEDEYRRNIETISYQHNQKINFLTIENEKRINEQKTENIKTNSRISILLQEIENDKKESDKKIESMIKNRQTELESVKSLNEEKISELKNEYERTITNMIKENEVYKTRFSNISSKSLVDVAECKNRYEIVVQNLKLEIEKTQGECQDRIQAYIQQVNNLKENTRRIQENMDNMTSSNMNNISKHRENLDKELTKRDILISQLERQLKITSQENVDKMGYMERKMGNILDECQKEVEKNNEYKEIIERAEQTVSILKAELIVNHEEKERYIEKLKLLDLLQGKNEQKLVELKNKEYEYSRMREENARVVASEVKIKEEITKIAEELTFVRQENDRKGKTYELMKNNLTKGLNKATQDIRAKEELIEFMKKQYEELENKGEIKRLKDYIQFLEKYKEEGNEKSIIDKKNYEDTIKNTIEMYEEKLNTIRMEKSVSVPDVVPTELAVITPVITPITELKNNDPVIKKEN